MSFSKGLNASPTTLTKNRTPGSVSPFSGLCSTCVEGCPGLCEVGKSAFRGREVLYPQPYGKTTFASEKDYPVDFSHLNIMGSAVGARGVEADSYKAVFHAVDTSLKLGSGLDKLNFKFPAVIAAMGSTQVAADNWEGLAAGAALSGVGIVIGENVCGMDSEARFANNRVIDSPALKRRLEPFRRWSDGSGVIAIQSNVEDTSSQVFEYAVRELGVEAVELKWGQGAKSIGGEVKIEELAKALELSRRGYLVYPDPENPVVQELYEKGAIKEFERHSRIGMVDERDFVEQVNELRQAGAKFVFLKTGAYRPRDLALAIKLASEAEIDLLTIDGAGGGTGMSPWRMMNEWGLPTIYLATLAYRYLRLLDEEAFYTPPVALAGGIALEDHIFKALALGAPYFKMVGMSRSPLTAAMVGHTMEEMAQGGKLPKNIASQYGETLESVFSTSYLLREKIGNEFEKLPGGALGVFTYFDRLKTGLQQLMCGSRKFSLEYLEREDLAVLTEEAARVTGLKHALELDAAEAETILRRSASVVK